MAEAIGMARRPRGDGDLDFAPTTPVQAAYGMVTCPDERTCQGGFDDHGAPGAFSVWVVWSVATTGPDAGVWVAINADTPHRAFSGP